MNLALDVPTQADCEQVRRWRHAALEGLRTPFRLTSEMQAEWYRETICKRESPHRYFSIREVEHQGLVCSDVLVAFGGLTNIEAENGCAEISLVTDPAKQRQGIGRESVRLLLDEGFNRLRLLTVYGLCYGCNPALPFWQTLVKEQQPHARDAMLAARKFHQGRAWDAYYFSFHPPSLTLG